MPNYKMVDADILDGAMLETAKAIREKGGTEELIPWNKSTGYKEAIEAITGGGGLNFEVVASETAPINPKPNTLWVDSPVPVNGWEVSADAPNQKTQELYKNIITIDSCYLDSSGTRKDNGSWSVTYPVDFPENTREVTVRVGSTSSSGVYHCFYNSNQELISTVLRDTGTTTYNVPEGATYMKLSIRADDTSPSVIALYSRSDEEGFVWIQNGKENEASFNAIDENKLIVSPAMCMQYHQGTWISKSIKGYNNGAWIPVENNIFYNSGNEYVAKTGGWDVVTVNGLESHPETLKLEDGLQIYCVNGTSSAFITNEAVNLSGYTKLCYKVDNIINSFRVGISTSRDAYYEGSSCIATQSVSNDGMHAVSIAYAGEAYLWISLYSSKSTIYSGILTKMWLE